MAESVVDGKQLRQGEIWLMEIPKARQVYEVALALFNTAPDWVEFFREILGINGAARIAFPTAEGMAQFEQTEEFAAIHQMIARLRENRLKVEPKAEDTRMITIRIPQSLHDALQVEAYEHHTSLNKLCISKLLQIVDEELVPSKKTRPVADVPKLGSIFPRS